MADEESSPSTTIAPTTTVPLVTTTTTTTSTTTISAEVADAAVAVVVSAIEAKNNFDLDGWLAAFEGGKRQGIPLFAEKILMNADERWEIIEPCQATGAFGSGGTIVECLIRDTTSFWGVGGFSDTKRQRNTVNSDGLITNSRRTFRAILGCLMGKGAGELIILTVWLAELRLMPQCIFCH